MKSFGDAFLNIGECLPDEGCAFRTTLIYDEGRWELVEFGQELRELQVLAGPIPAIEGMVEILTIAHRRRFKPEQLGFEAIFDEPDPQQKESASSSSDSSSESPEKHSPIGEPADGGGEEKQQHVAVALPGSSADVKELPGKVSDPEQLDVDGVILTPSSTLKELRAACLVLGIGKSGGRATVFSRIASHQRKMKLSERVEIAKELESDRSRQPVLVPDVPQPTAEQVAEHSATHLPYAPWCAFCVAHKARDAKHSKSTSVKGVPLVAMDFSFTSREKDEAKKLTVLVLRDKDSGTIDCIPVRGKGGAQVTKYLVTEVCRLLNMLGHTDVVLKSDGEPTMIGLQSKIQETRARLGLRTQLQQAPKGDHQANGMVEQTVQITRLHAGVLLEQYEQKSGCLVSTEHPLHSWCFRHAAWVLNRYSPHHGVTAFEQVTQSEYSGKVVSFGECVMARAKSSTKGRAGWLKSIWLGKIAISDLHIVCTKSGSLLLTRCVKRLPEASRWDKEMHECLRDYSWDHPGLTAGHLAYVTKQGRKTQQVIQEFVHPILDDGAPLSALMDSGQSPMNEAGSEPSSDVKDGAGSDGGAVDPAVVPMEDDTGQRTEQTGDGRGLQVDEQDERPPKQARIEPQKKARVQPAQPASSSRLASPPTFAAGIRIIADGSVMRVVGGEKLEHVDELLSGELAEDEAMVLEEYFDHECRIDPDDRFSHDWIKAEDAGIPDAVEARERNETLFPGVLDECNPDDLYYPGSVSEPELDEATLMALDALAERVEVARLASKGVLRKVTDTGEQDALRQTHRSLNARFVHTWRQKVVNHQSKWLRRARLVAKEFAHLDPDRGGLFAPSSSAIVSRVVPSLYMHFKKSKQWTMGSMDVHDAYLTCDQVHPTLITISVGDEVLVFDMLKCVPGQRDGAVIWFDSFTGYLESRVNASSCGEIPAFYRIQEIDGTPGFMVLLIHVDDVLYAGSHQQCDAFEKIVQERYQVLIDRLHEVGDQITFLKRQHFLWHDNVLLLQPPLKHFTKLLETVGCDMATHRPRKTPLPVGKLPTEVDQTPLDEERASSYRSGVGPLLYLSADVVEAQYGIRVLSQFMSMPTFGSWKLLVHMALYLWGARGHALAFEEPIPGKGLITESKCPFLIEAISDADWAGDKDTRKSTSGCMILCNSHLWYSASRGQRVVALSSGESEFYSSISTAADALFLRAVLGFALGDVSCIELKLLGDSSAARGIQQRRGTGKVRHLEARHLWLQSKVKAGVVQVGVVQTKWNPADLATKALSRQRIRLLLGLIGI